MSTPYIGFGNDTLKKLPIVHKGDMVACPHCKGSHPLLPTDDGGEILMFYKCADKSYLGAVDGRLVVGTPVDCSGQV